MVDYAVQTDREIPEKYNFYKYFGKIIPITFKHIRHQIKPTRKFYFIQRRVKLHSDFDEANEIIEKYIECWKTLKT